MPKLEENQISAISRFFSAAVIQEMARRGRSPLFARLLKESCLVDIFSETKKVSQLFEIAFSFLKRKHCRHEYIYKAALTQKVLLGVHNLKTAAMLSEFRVGKCKADYVILNGTAAVYEIKSERDTLSRLERQVAAYMKVFARVNVIAGENHIDSVFSLVPKEVGILKLTNRHQITTLRESENAPERTSPVAIFEAIQLREAKIILEDIGIKVPNFPNTQLYEELRSRFIKLNAHDAHYGMVKTLKKTRNLVSLEKLLNELPPSLHTAALSTSLRMQDYGRLLNAINTPTQDAVMWA
ncbi:MAG: sce7726 family protein [Nitrospinae bacterium]|nr:sce7726 family protein [Nitrospinota bacterium]